MGIGCDEGAIGTMPVWPRWWSLHNLIFMRGARVSGRLGESSFLLLSWWSSPLYRNQFQLKWRTFALRVFEAHVEWCRNGGWGAPWMVPQMVPFKCLKTPPEWRQNRVHFEHLNGVLTTPEIPQDLIFCCFWFNKSFGEKWEALIPIDKHFLSLLSLTIQTESICIPSIQIMSSTVV